MQKFGTFSSKTFSFDAWNSISLYWKISNHGKDWYHFTYFTTSHYQIFGSIKWLLMQWFIFTFPKLHLAEVFIQCHKYMYHNVISSVEKLSGYSNITIRIYKALNTAYFDCQWLLSKWQQKNCRCLRGCQMLPYISRIWVNSLGVIGITLKTLRHDQIADIFRCHSKHIFLKVTFYILIRIWSKCVILCSIHGVLALALVMVCYQTGEEPFSESMKFQFTNPSITWINCNPCMDK